MVSYQTKLITYMLETISSFLFILPNITLYLHMFTKQTCVQVNILIIDCSLFDLMKVMVDLLSLYMFEN